MNQHPIPAEHPCTSVAARQFSALYFTGTPPLGNCFALLNCSRRNGVQRPRYAEVTECPHRSVDDDIRKPPLLVIHPARPASQNSPVEFWALEGNGRGAQPPLSQPPVSMKIREAFREVFRNPLHRATKRASTTIPTLWTCSQVQSDQNDTFEATKVTRPIQGTYIYFRTLSGVS